MSSTAIDEIEERLHDLVVALREAGCDDLADPLAEHAHDFVDPRLVRRAVNAINAQLERWRLQPGEAPDTPKIMFCANRLEDACRQALASGVIAAAPVSRGEQVRRKTLLVLATLLGASLLLLVPIALIEAGVDFADVGQERRLPTLRLPRGEEATLRLAMLEPPSEPNAVSAVEFGPLGGCGSALPSGATCGQVEARLWPSGRLPTFELKLPHQVYGVLFAFDRLEVGAGGIGTGTLLIAATDDTPEGLYELPLTGTYRGYTPQRCEFLDRLMDQCKKPRMGEGEAHRDVPTPLVVLDVMPGDPSRRTGEKRLQAAMQAERHEQAEERAKQIEGVLSDLSGVLAETEKLLARKRYEETRERVRKLQTLFAPLDALTTAAGSDVPKDVADARERLDRLRDKLGEFEQRLFDQAFTTLTADANRLLPEEQLLSRVAKANRVSPAYVQAIYTEGADEIQTRLEARAKARADTLKSEQQAREQRCGPLPLDAWKEVGRYVKARYEQPPRIRVVLGECLSPRLTERDCWELRCQFLTKEEVAIERPPVSKRHEASFFLVRGSVVRQQGG